MLDRSKIAREIEQLTQTLFVDLSPQYALTKKLWQEIASDQFFCLKVQTFASFLPVPTFLDTLDRVIAPAKSDQCYVIKGIDGSQIYPDRHQGFSCFLINIGTVLLRYGKVSNEPAAIFNTEPYLVANAELELNASIDLVNAMRQELELQAGLQKIDDTNVLILLDGALVFWHLVAKDEDLKERFLPRYYQLLEQYRMQKRLMASYISQPKSREVSNLLRLKLADFDSSAVEKYKVIDRINDAIIFSSFLQPGQRSIVFGSRAQIGLNHPEHVRTHFFYLHNGVEIGRVEIPAWIAADEALVNWIAALVLDQCTKGQGYPVVLAEAHEQAVVKGPDRDFFYHLLQKKALESKRYSCLSQKSICKRNAMV